MKYINTPKKMEYKLCPLCKQNETHIMHSACKECRDAYNRSEKNLDLDEWVILNIWCRRLPHFTDYFIKFKIWKLYDIDAYFKPLGILLIVVFVLGVIGGITDCIAVVS